jgi:hypothetical protein
MRSDLPQIVPGRLRLLRKLRVNPARIPQETDIICSPIQAKGRKETNSSSS